MRTQVTIFLRINDGLHDLNSDEVISVWPYAIYYPYYEQYITMVSQAFYQIGICLVPVFVLTFIFLGFDFASGLIVFFTITLIIVNTYGICALWEVDFNPLTLINLIASIGIAMEFTGHTVRQFALSTRNGRKDRIIFFYFFFQKLVKF